MKLAWRYAFTVLAATEAELAIAHSHTTRKCRPCPDYAGHIRADDVHQRSWDARHPVCEVWIEAERGFDRNDVEAVVGKEQRDEAYILAEVDEGWTRLTTRFALIWIRQVSLTAHVRSHFGRVANLPVAFLPDVPRNEILAFLVNPREDCHLEELPASAVSGRHYGIGGLGVRLFGGSRQGSRQAGRFRRA